MLLAWTYTLQRRKWVAESWLLNWVYLFLNHSLRSAHYEYVPAAMHSFSHFFPLELILPGPQKSSQPKKLSEENYTGRILDDMASAWAHTVITNLFTFSLRHISVVWTSFSPWNRYVGITWISSPFSRQPEKNRWRSWCRSYQWNKLYPWWDGELLHRLVVCSFGRD